MRLIRNSFAAAAALAISTVGAQAADMAVKAAPMAAAIPQATGYVEVYGGGARTNYDTSACDLPGGTNCNTFSTRLNGVVIGGAGRATYWFAPYVSTQLDAQAEGTSYDFPTTFGPFSAGHFSNHSYLIAGHLNARSSQQGLIGLFAGAGDAGGIFGGAPGFIMSPGLGTSQRHVIFGAEGQYYYNNFTAYLQGGYDTTVNTVGLGISDVNAWFIRGTGRYFVTPNLMLEGTGLYANGKVNLDSSFSGPGVPTSYGFQTWLWQAKAEWRFDTMPFSVFAKYQGSQTKYDQVATFGETVFNTKTTDNRFLLGLRLYMGEGTLLSNDRKGSTLDIIDVLGTPTGPLMFSHFNPRFSPI